MHDAISRPSHRAVLPNQIGRREWAVEHGDLADRALEVGVAGQRADRERSRPWAGHDFELRERHGPKTLDTYVSSVSIRLTRAGRALAKGERLRRR